MPNHFAKVCWKKLNITQKSRQGNRLNNVEIAETTVQNTNSENQNVNCISYKEQFNSDYDSLDDNYVATVENLSKLSIVPENMMITIGNTDCPLLLDSGSGCTFINMSLAMDIMLNCAQSQLSVKKPLELKSFSNDIVETLGTLKTPVCCNDWKIQQAKTTIVADGFRPFLDEISLTNWE